MPTIVEDLGGLKHISWVVTAYTLVTAVTTPVRGELGDLVGRKPVHLASSRLLMLPMMIPVVIASTIAGKIMSATGKYRIFPVVGALFLTAGLFLLATMDTATSHLLTSLYMVLVGIGLGFTLQMSGTIAQNSVSLRDMGAAMSSVNLFRTLGGSLGVAVFGSPFTRAVRSALPADGEADPNALRELPAAARNAYLDAVTTGTGHIFLSAAVLCALAFLAALFVIEVPLKKAGPPAPAADTPAHATS